jgi:hypothetical protein
MKDNTSPLQTRPNYQSSFPVKKSHFGWQQVIDRVIQIIQHRAEPQVTEQIDQDGNLYYQVYHPKTGKSATFGSPAEIRWWIEQS